MTPSLISTPSTISTEDIYATLRDAIKTYERPPDGITLKSLFQADDRVWVRAAPPKAVFPYITLRLTRQSCGSANGYRETGFLEVQCLGRPESQLPLVQAAMDVVDGAFLGYREPGSGIMFMRERQRDTLPMFNDPADSSVVGEVSQFQLVMWPRVLVDLRPNP